MQNYSLLSIPAAWFISMTPHFYAYGLIKKHLPHFDAANPRHALTALSNSNGEDKLKLIQLRILRGKAAHANGLENLALFSGAILAANVAGVPVNKVNSHALAYLISRVIYNAIYVHLENRKYFYFRTIIYAVGVVITTSLYISAFYASNQ